MVNAIDLRKYAKWSTILQHSQLTIDKLFELFRKLVNDFENLLSKKKSGFDSAGNLKWHMFIQQRIMNIYIPHLFHIRPGCLWLR